MATSTKSRRGGKKGKSKDKAAAAAQSNGGDRLTPAERRLEGVSLSDRRKAVKMAKNGESIQDIAKLVKMTPNKAKYLVMQQQVEDGDVPAVKATDEAILKALKKDDGYNSVAWVCCRARVSGGRVQKVADEAGFEFNRGRPKGGGGKKSSTAARRGKTETDSGTRARRGKKSARRKRGKKSPNA